MTATIETFKPVAACSDVDLHSGIAEGLWLARSLFSAFVVLNKSDDRHDEISALAFLGEAIVIEVEAKQKEFADRKSAGGAR